MPSSLVDAHIHHDLTFPQAIGPDGSPPAHGDHRHIGLQAEGGQVPGAGIAEGHSGVVSRSSIMAAGLPTTELRPTTTARLPDSGTIL